MNIYIHTYAYMHAITIKEKKGHQLESRYGEGLEEGKRRENLCNYLIKEKKRI